MRFVKGSLVRWECGAKHSQRGGKLGFIGGFGIVDCVSDYSSTAHAVPLPSQGKANWCHSAFSRRDVWCVGTYSVVGGDALGDPHPRPTKRPCVILSVANVPVARCGVERGKTCNELRVLTSKSAGALLGYTKEFSVALRECV